MKLTRDLVPGDRVRLPGGLIRTVREVKESNFLAAHNEPIYYVLYVEGHTTEWSEGNSSIRFGEWEVVS